LASIPYCGNIYPVYEAKFERKIKDFVETTDNPFDEGKGQDLGVDNRVIERRKGKKRKRRFSYKQNHEDPVIQAEINKGNTISIMQDY
jgi:hypothetical protein